jgi:hypothetical protein
MVLVKFLQAPLAQPPQGPQGNVESTSGMPLGKNELIVLPYDAVIQGQEEIKRGEIAPQMSDAAIEMHLEQPKFGFSEDRFQ